MVWTCLPPWRHFFYYQEVFIPGGVGFASVGKSFPQRRVYPAIEKTNLSEMRKGNFSWTTSYGKKLS